MVYKILKNDAIQSLHEVPYWYQTPANLCRSTKGRMCCQVDPQHELQIPAKATFGEAQVLLKEDCNGIISFQILDGTIPTKGMIKQQKFALTPEEISLEFHRYWKPFWLREHDAEQWEPESWESFVQELESIPLPKYDLQVVLDDPAVWYATIKSLKNGKAHGVCGWRHEELKKLPFAAIEHLVMAFQVILKKGLSNNMMKARTVLLAKIPEPLGMQHTRPITILSTIARLVSKICAQQLLSQLGKVLPVQISGGLPNRGSKDLALQQQFLIEKSLTNGTGLGGYTLDLVKAFNMIPRWPLKELFSRIGIPQIVITYWFGNLTRLTRYPQIGDALGSPVPSTCGIPEGDSLSVVGMVILSVAFFFRIQQPTVRPFSYADNWSWLAENQKEHFKTLVRVLNWVSCLRMKMDFAKSWAWGTNKAFKDQAKEFECLFPSGDISISILQTAKDLGIQMHYDKQQMLGSILERIQTGVKRAHRLEWLPIDVNDKAHFIQTSVWPTALYSAEFQAIGQKHFSDLRRSATKALTGDHQFASTYLACSTICPELQDPMLYVVCNALRSLRRLYTYHPHLAKECVSYAASFTGKYSIGPASALRVYLNWLEWTIHPNGDIEGPFQHHLNVFTSSGKELKKELTYGWQFIVFSNIQHRKGCGQQMNLLLTRKVIQSLTPQERSIILLNMVGGYQPSAVKRIWADDEDGKCEFCGELDSRSHRLLHCHVLADVRDQHKEAVQSLQHVCPDWIYLPLARHHDEIDILNQILQSRSHPTPEKLTMTRSDKGVHIRCFTDGSCILPTEVECRRAAWALVQDTSESDLQRNHLLTGVSHLSSNLQIPDLRCVTTALTSGRQTPARSEVAAMLHAVQSAHFTDPQATADFFTDAQYVCNFVHWCEETSKNVSQHKISNFDLVSQLQDVWKPSQYKVHKLKSHRKIEEAVDSCDLWCLIANHLVDRAATAALNREVGEIQIMATRISDFQHQEYIRLRQVYRYLADLNTKRLGLQKENKQNQLVFQNTEGNHELQNMDIYEASYFMMVGWSHESYVSLPIGEWKLNVVQACGIGGNTASQLWKWIQLLRWPTDEHEVHPDDKGISWFELAVNYAVCLQKLLPIQVAVEGRHVHYAPYSSEIASLQQKTLEISQSSSIHVGKKCSAT